MMPPYLLSQEYVTIRKQRTFFNAGMGAGRYYRINETFVYEEQRMQAGLASAPPRLPRCLNYGDMNALYSLDHMFRANNYIRQNGRSEGGRQAAGRDVCERQRNRGGNIFNRRTGKSASKQHPCGECSGCLKGNKKPEITDEKQLRTVFARNIFSSLTEEELAEYFTIFGEVEKLELLEAVVPTQPYADDPFVCPSEPMSEDDIDLYLDGNHLREIKILFKSSICASRAVEALSQLGLSVRREIDRELDSYSVYFCNLPMSMSKEDLADLASACGEVLMSWIVGFHCTSIMECGCGFVRMRRAADCMTAVRHFNGAFLKGSALPLRVRLGHKRKYNSRPLNTLWCTYRHPRDGGPNGKIPDSTWDGVFYYPPEVKVSLLNEGRCFRRTSKQVRFTTVPLSKLDEVQKSFLRGEEEALTRPAANEFEYNPELDDPVPSSNWCDSSDNEDDNDDDDDDDDSSTDAQPKSAPSKTGVAKETPKRDETPPKAKPNYRFLYAPEKPRRHWNKDVQQDVDDSAGSNRTSNGRDEDDVFKTPPAHIRNQGPLSFNFDTRRHAAAKRHPEPAYPSNFDTPYGKYDHTMNAPPSYYQPAENSQQGDMVPYQQTPTTPASYYTTPFNGYSTPVNNQAASLYGTPSCTPISAKRFGNNEFGMFNPASPTLSQDPNQSWNATFDNTAAAVYGTPYRMPGTPTTPTFVPSPTTTTYMQSPTTPTPPGYGFVTPSYARVYNPDLLKAPYAPMKYGFPLAASDSSTSTDSYGSNYDVDSSASQTSVNYDVGGGYDASGRWSVGSNGPSDVYASASDASFFGSLGNGTDSVYYQTTDLGHSSSAADLTYGNNATAGINFGLNGSSTDLSLGVNNYSATDLTYNGSIGGYGQSANSKLAVKKRSAAIKIEFPDDMKKQDEKAGTSAKNSFENDYNIQDENDENIMKDNNRDESKLKEYSDGLIKTRGLDLNNTAKPTATGL